MNRGFPEGKVHYTPIPDLFLENILPHIDTLGELKLSLYIFHRLEHTEGTFRYLRLADLLEDVSLLQSLHEDHDKALEKLHQALEKTEGRGTIIKTELDLDGKEEILYFLNSPRGRAALRAIESGQWRPTSEDTSGPFPEIPNIFQLYEENIGPITPLIAETLAEAEDSYPAHWIEESFTIAVQKNKRNLRYVMAILERWQREGYHGKKGNLKDRRDTEEDRRRYIEGEYSDFIEH